MKKKYLLLGIVCVLVVFVVCYLIITSKSNNTNEKEKNEIVNKIKEEYDYEKFYFENLSKDGYGFIKVFKEDSYDIVELNNNGDDKTIMSFKNNDEKIWHEPFHMLISGNNLYFEITHSEENEQGLFKRNEKYRMYKINLNTLEVTKLYESNTFNLVYDDYDVYNNYVFRPRKMNENYRDEYKVFRYDIKNDKETVINDTLEIDDLFVCDDKLYLSNDKYYVMDIDGSNLKEINKQEYSEKQKKCFYRVEGLGVDDDMHFMYKDKKVFIKDNKLMYGDEVLYTAKKGTKINFSYTPVKGKVGLRNFRDIDLSEEDLGFHLINLETKKEDKLLDEKFYDFNQVLFR